MWKDKTGSDAILLELTGKHIEITSREKLQNHLDQTESEFCLRILWILGKKAEVKHEEVLQYFNK